MIKNPNKCAFPKEYQAWKGIRKRCGNPRCRDFKNYGGRGISRCERWDSFDNFLSDLGPKTSEKHTLERIDNDGNYEPGNCRWATRPEQNVNKRNLIRVEYLGEVVPITVLENRLGLSRRRIGDRLRKGWTVEEAINTPQRTSPGEGIRIQPSRSMTPPVLPPVPAP